MTSAATSKTALIIRPPNSNETAIQFGSGNGFTTGFDFESWAIVSDQLSVKPNPVSTINLDQPQASGGSALLAFASTSGVSVGQVVFGFNIPLNSQVASIVSTAQATRAANGSFSSGQKVIPMSATGSFGVGQQCKDTTSPTSIDAGNVIASIQANTSITMTSNIAVNSGGAADSITCDPTVTMTQASTDTLTSGGVLFYANATTVSSASAFYDGGDASVAGNLNVGGSINGIVPTNGAASRSLSSLAALFNPSPYATFDVGVKPYGDAQLITNRSLTGSTVYTMLEVPSDFTAIKLRFANLLGSSYTIRSLTVAASSQAGAPGAASLNSGNGMYGVSAFNSAGSDVTATAGTWQIASFGLNGVDGDWLQNPADFTNAAATTTATSCSGSTLNVASGTGIANGQTAVPTNPVNTANSGLYYHVTGVSGTVVTLDQTVACTNGDTWVFLPINFVVPASTNLTIPSLISTDPIRVVSTPRIDGPVISGETPFLDGAATPLVNGMTANVVGATSVSLTGGAVPSPLAKGQLVRFCTQITVNGAITPTNTIALSSGTGVATGMTAMIGATDPASPSQGYDTVFMSVVSGVAGNNVTTTDMIDPSVSGNWSAGTMTFASSTPTGTPQFTVSGTPAGGATSITLNDPGVHLADWQAAIAGGVTVKATSTNIQASGTAGITVNAINSGTGVLTLASGINAALLNNQPVILYLTRTISGTITPAQKLVMSAAPTNNLLPGTEFVGTGWKTNTHAVLNGVFNTWLSMTLDKSPTQTIANSASVWACHAPMKLLTAASTGDASLSFAQTNYPNRLLLVRINYTADFASVYQGPGNDYGAAIHYGLPMYLGGSCNPANDSVLTPSLATNTGGGCSASLVDPVYSVQLQAPTPVASFMVVGDSKFQGATTPYNSSNFTALAAADMSSPTLPISVINCAWSGAPGSLFVPIAKQCLTWMRPTIVTIEGIANNWPSTPQGYAQALSTSEGIATMARKQGALPILADGYPGAMFGLSTLLGINQYQVAGRSYLSQFSKSGIPYFDTASIIGVQFGGNTYIASPYTGDGLHLLLGGHQALMGSFESLVAPYVMQP